jgi:UDP-glucose 4-epimerase
MHVLVTGGAGFIGSHLARAYLDRGDEVTVVDTLATGRRERVPSGAEFQLLDVASPLFGRLLQLTPFDLINHQAAQVSVRQSVEHPSVDAAINVVGTVHVLEAAISAGVPRVVLASSSAVYGDPPTVPIGESAPTHPLSPYGVAKRSIELYAEALSALRGLHVICLRYANVYGPGAEPHTEAGVVPLFVHALRSGWAPQIFGDGTATRDYISVDDIVRGNLAAERLQGFHVMNLGTGVETSVNQLAALLRERLGGPPAQHVAPRPGEIMRSVLDATRANELLGWRDTTPLAEGLNRVLEPQMPASS